MNESEHDHETTTEEGSSVDQWESIEVVHRPRWPKVIGIFSIVWGSLGLCCLGLGTAWGVVAPGLVKGQLNGAPMPSGMQMQGTDWALMVISLGMAVLLIFAGITATSYRPNTRIMHLLYGLISIPLVVWSYIHNSAKQESLRAWAEQYPDNPIAQSMDPSQNPGAAVGQILGLVLMIVLGFGIPIFYLVWFGLIKTRPEQITGGDEGVY